MEAIGAVSSLKALIEILTGMAKLKVDADVALRVFDALQKAADVQQQLFETQSALIQLQSQNEELRRSLREQAEWSRRGNSLTRQFSTIAAACEKLPRDTVDGEVAAIDSEGGCRSTFLS